MCLFFKIGLCFVQLHFQGHAGFRELQNFGRQATEFGREVVTILHER